jgi:hypothetical protein
MAGYAIMPEEKERGQRAEARADREVRTKPRRRRAKRDVRGRKTEAKKRKQSAQGNQRRVQRARWEKAKRSKIVRTPRIHAKDVEGGAISQTEGWSGPIISPAAPRPQC